MSRGIVIATLLLFAWAATSSTASSEQQQQQQQGLWMAAKNFNADDAPASTSSIITDRRFTPLLPETAPRKPGGLDRHSFTVADDAFYLDGEPFTLLSGEVHQFRIPSAYWRDRLRRVRALGFNAVTVYVPW